MTPKMLLRLFSLATVLSLLLLIFSTAFGGTTLQIMPLGDSITSGYSAETGYQGGGYRDPLYTLLHGIGCDFTFVGSNTDRPTTTLTNAGQINHEGHGGYKINQINDNLFGNDGTYGNIGGYWLEGITGTRAPLYPDIILLKAGTNDVTFYTATETQYLWRDRLNNLINTIFTNRPNTAVLVSNMIPQIGLEGNSQAYNALIPAVVDSYAAQGLGCYFVDMHSQLLSPDDLSDTVHPNTSGYQKMANTWFAALQANDLLTVPEPSSLLMLLTLLGLTLCAAMKFKRTH